MRIYLQALVLVLLFGGHYASAQTATVSYPFAVGRTSCGSGTSQIHYYTYNGTTNTIASISSTTTTNPVRRYTPQLRIGGTPGGTQRFTTSLSSVSFNPKDHNIYYLWTNLSASPVRTYAWRWPAGAGVQPLDATNKLDTIRSFPFDILGVAFDENGNGFMLEFPASEPYVPILRSIDFATGVIGGQDTLQLTGGATIYGSGSGDVAMSPSGQMFFVVDNKLFTPDYKSYMGTGQKLTCTYIDTVINSATGNFVGLTYAEGETVSAYSGGGCPFYETNPLTAATTNITKSGTVYSGVDMATIISGIGAAKRLVSYTSTGTPNQYDVVYDVFIKNYGNMDITNVQVTDDLTQINGAGNVSNVTTSFIGTAPGGGIALNAGFNGNSDKNLLNGTGVLVNYPETDNSFTVRISCRLSNIQNGVIYYNSAIATALDFNSNTLRDSSANGSTPDLNTNDKPDDPGEGQRTPFLIGVTAQTPPCASLSQTLYTENFGTGADITSLTTTGNTPETDYTGSTTAPLAIDQYMLTSNAQNGYPARWISLTDHTTGTGRMMVVNADVSNKTFFRDTINTLCSGQQYSLLFYAAFTGNSSYQTVCDAFGGFQYPRIMMTIRDAASGAIITQIPTADITSTSWNQYGLKWVMPAGFTSIIFELSNDAPGGCGNDLAIDDIQFGTCDALPEVSIAAPTDGCVGGSTTLNATVNDAGAVPGTKEYQWQTSSDSVAWSNLGAVTTSASYTINPVTAGDVNKYYRVIVAAQGNMGTASCQYTSPGYLLTAKAASAAPTSISQSRTAICPGDPVRLAVVGGSLGANAVWRWYTGSCGGTLIGTGSDIVVSPLVATTYYVRAEGDCNNTACAQVTLSMNCDIDDDNDGIPDYVEGNGTDPSADDDSDGILNYLDTDFAGRVDTNSDGVDDRFDADLDGVPNHLDLDSDNDGIADVVESTGVDANGDGRIDNYTDTDADGFSQNVDGNNTGAATSGNGLNAIDLDNDGVPNYFDLDSDNDGIPDVIEVYGTDLDNNGRIDGFADSDADGFSDNVDGDVGNDGVAENAANTLLRTGTDTDADGRANSYPYKNMDADSKANPYDLESDRDGITDVREAGFADTDWNGRVDGTYNANGWSITVAALASLNMPNTDGTGRVNAYDIDADDDGVPDNIEGQTTDNYLLPSGTDTDSDGIDNTYDNFAGFGGDGIHVFDRDGDGTPDYIDTDTDSDGVIDRIEGNDLNLNGQPDDNTGLTGVDTDDDGLDDRFDNDNTSARGTSLYMGTNGSTSGDASPGSITTVQQSGGAATGCGTERDWRCLPYILSCDILTFKGALQDQRVQLDWSALCRQEVKYFIIERSTDRTTFIETGRVAGRPVLNQIDSYHGTDDITDITANTIHYRLKAVMLNGETSISNIISVRRGNNQQTAVQVFPNPVNDQLQISVHAATSLKAQVYILNGNGKQVKKYTEQVIAGNNTFTYSDTRNLPNGIYYLRINLGDEIITHKFSILK